MLVRLWAAPRWGPVAALALGAAGGVAWALLVPRGPVTALERAVFEHSGHRPQFEEPAEFAALMRRIVAQTQIPSEARLAQP